MKNFGINLSEIKREQKRLLAEKKISKAKNGDYWLNGIVFDQDKYPDSDVVMNLVESVSKEEREDGKKGIKIGNIKESKFDNEQGDEKGDPFADDKSDDDDLPF